MAKLTKSRLGKLLKEYGTPEKDGDGDFSIGFVTDGGLEVAVTLIFSQDGSLLQMFAQPKTLKKIPRKRMGEAVLFCNEWNLEESVFEKAYFIKEHRQIAVTGYLGLQHEVSDKEFAEVFLRFSVATLTFFNAAAEKFDWDSDE